MARGIIRKPSFNKIVGAYRSQWKRMLRRMFIYGYGKKGMGWWRNPKKAWYNFWYHRTSISIPRMLGYKPSYGATLMAVAIASFLNVFLLPFEVTKTAKRSRRVKRACRAKAKKTSYPKTNSAQKAASKTVTAPKTEAKMTPAKTTSVPRPSTITASTPRTTSPKTSTPKPASPKEETKPKPQ